MKKTKLALSVSLLLLSVSAYADENTSIYGFTTSGSAALTSDYIWRGISQTANSAAIQGSLDIEHESGFYTGVWGSNFEGGTDASMELDVYAGFANDFSVGKQSITYDIGYLHYDYPLTDSLNVNELYLGFSTTFMDNLNSSLYYYQDLKSETTIGYIDLSVDYTLPDWVWNTTVSAHYGYYAAKNDGDYSDWKLGISKSIGGFGFEFSYTQTDLPNSPITGDNYVFTVSRAFGDVTASSDGLPEGIETSASVALTTDYMWRGMSQTMNGGAIQGSFDVSHDLGFYIGAWGSNVEYGQPSTNNLELDVYGGFSRDFQLAGIDMNYDIGWLHYDYPLATESSNFNEIYFGLSAVLTKNLNTSLYYYQDINVENKMAIGYVDVAADYTLPEALWGITTSAHYGAYILDNKTNSDWKIAVAKDISIINVEIAYVDSSIDDKYSDSRVVGTFSTSF